MSGGDWAIIDGKQSQPLNLRRYGPFYGHHYQWLQFGWGSGNRPSYSCFYINDQGYPQGSPLWRNDFNSPDKCKNQDKKTIDQDRAKAEAKKKAEDAAKDKGSSIGGDSNENSLVITFNQYKGLTKAKIPNGCYITYVEAKDANTPAEVILSLKQ